MKRNIYILLILNLFLLNFNLFGYGTSSGTKITNGSDKGISGDSDLPGDSTIHYHLPLSPVYHKACTNITISTVASGYDISILRDYGEKTEIVGNEILFQYSITNYGNISDSIRIVVTEASNKGSGFFSGNIYSIWQSTNIIAGPSSSLSWITPSISPDAQINFDVRILVPGTVIDQDLNVSKVEIYNQSGSGTNDQWPGDYAINPATPDLSGSRDYQFKFIGVRASSALITVTKSVDFTSIISNDIISYTIFYSNISVFSVSNCYIVDEVPQGTLYMSDSSETNNNLHNGTNTSFYWDGAVWQNSSFDTPVTAPQIRKIFWNFSDPVSSGEYGYVRFKVRIN